jgi:hypothetical protein
MITDHRGSDQIKDARMSQSIHTLQQGLVLPAYVQMEMEEKLLPGEELQDDEDRSKVYNEGHCSIGAYEQDDKLTLVFEW